MNNKNSPVKVAMIISLVIVAILIALVLINNKSESNAEETMDRQPPIDGQPTLGDANAPVTVVEFGDFKCPACKLWGEGIFSQLKSEYVDTGKVKFSYINVLFHGEESKLGSLAAESIFKQKPDSYWDFHKELYDEQPSDDGQWITQDKILEIANRVPNIDTDELKKALENKSEINEVNKDSKLVTEFNVQFTPTIMVNDTMIEDPFNYEEIETAIDNELDGK